MTFENIFALLTELLEGKSVDLKIVEKEDLPHELEWFNDLDFWGQYERIEQASKAEFEKDFEKPHRIKDFFIQKKDGTKVGILRVFALVPSMQDVFGLEIGYSLLAEERGKGYCTEAVNILLDFLFLSSTVFRIQAHADVRNKASQRVLEKTGFQKEGTIRKGYFARGERRDSFIYSILRDEWKEPRILEDPSQL